MSLSYHVAGCACCGMNRRRFLSASCAACASAAGLLSVARPVGAAEPTAKLRIRIVYALHADVQPKPDWPNIGFDFVPVMQQITGALANRYKNIEFLVSKATGPEEAKQILDQDATACIDGYIVCQLNCWNRVVQAFAASGKPTLYSDLLYAGSGGFLVYTAAFLRRQTPNVGYVGSSHLEDLVAAVQCFEQVKQCGSAADFAAATAKIRKERTPAAGDLTCKPDAFKCLLPEECLRKMKESKILAFGGKVEGSTVLDGMGIEVVHLPFTELNDAWKAADKDQARELADRWQNAAALIAGVSRETLETSAAMYLAQKAVMDRHGANAITINCLGGFYGGHLHAYPCMGFHQLCNDGLVGGCECDLNSTATMLTITALTQGRPGFISDPVIDTATRQIIYAHCVASNRMFGPEGEANPFQILTHSEDRQGAAVRSLMPLGYMTTTVKFDPRRKAIVFHRGKAMANVMEDRACRTKLAAEPVGDLEKLFTEWDHWGWHRVTVYGDLKEPIFALADAMGWKIVEEA